MLYSEVKPYANSNRRVTLPVNYEKPDARGPLVEDFCDAQHEAWLRRF